MLQDYNQLNINACDKRTTPKMNGLLQNESISRLSYDETLFLSYQKVPKVRIACSYSKEGGLY